MIGNPAVAAFVAHHDLLYADLGDPVRLLRGDAQTALSRFWPYAADRLGAVVDHAEIEGDNGGCAPYSDLMTRTQALVSEAVLDAYPFARHRRLMDVGGGEGAFLAALAKRAPNLALALFDLPAVAARARARLAAAGFSGRVEAIAGDMLRDPLPRGADVISLVRVLHDHDDEAARTIVGAVHHALPREGRPGPRRAHGRRAGRGADGRGLFWFLPPGDGPRTTANAQRNRQPVEGRGI